MTYSNFARRRGSKDKTKRMARRGMIASAALGGLAGVTAGAAAMKNAGALKALGRQVRNKIGSAAKDGAEIATAAGGAAKRIGKKQVDKAKTLAMIDGKIAKARVGQAVEAVKSTAKKAKNKAGDAWMNAKRKGYSAMGNKSSPRRARKKGDAQLF